MGGYPAGCAGERSSTGATTALALATWQRTIAGKTAAGAAGDGVRRDIPRDPAHGNRDATSAPQERKSPESIMSQGQCVARLFGPQPPKEGREKPQKAELEDGLQETGEEEEARQTTPQDAKAAESHTPGGHGASLKVHKAFLPSLRKK